MNTRDGAPGALQGRELQEAAAGAELEKLATSLLLVAYSLLVHLGMSVKRRAWATPTRTSSCSHQKRRLGTFITSAEPSIEVPATRCTSRSVESRTLFPDSGAHSTASNPLEISISPTSVWDEASAEARCWISCGVSSCSHARTIRIRPSAALKTSAVPGPDISQATAECSPTVSMVAASSGCPSNVAHRFA
jgi:hypothetical protein